MTRLARRCTVTVCRDCCCGTGKHPDVDHDGQLRRLTTGAARVRVSECLDVCEYSNVVVVQPSPAGRRAGGRPVWLGFVLDDAALDAVTAWVGRGGPGLAPMPDLLDLYLIARPPAVEPTGPQRTISDSR